VQAIFEAGFPMSTPRIPAPLQSPASPKGEARPVLRAKTIATRVTPEELAEVEAAAEGAGETVVCRRNCGEALAFAPESRANQTSGVPYAERCPGCVKWRPEMTLPELFHHGFIAIETALAVALPGRFGPVSDG
jgi:hypothetical protein